MYEVKFRGKSAITGEIIYGIGVKKYPDYTMMILDCLVGEEVEPDSIAQLVGYDKNDKEIYSDDIVFDLDGNIRLVADVLLNFNSIGGHFNNVILKEN